jgi:hypothetical protein
MSVTERGDVRPCCSSKRGESGIEPAILVRVSWSLEAAGRSGVAAFRLLLGDGFDQLGDGD